MADVTRQELPLRRLRNGLVISLLILPPWAFAAAHPITQTLFNCVGSALATVFVIQELSRRPVEKPSLRGAALAALTCILLAYATVVLLNSPARISFLPSSVDAERTAFTLWSLCGVTALFWSIRAMAQEDGSALPRLLKIVVVNAALLGMVSIAQRLTDPYHVLWVYRPMVTNYYYVFGPFEYRATASQFFNVLWPVALGLFLKTRERWLVPICVVLMVCPAITSSRGGLLMMLIGLFIFGVSLQLGGRLPRSVIGLAALVFALVAILGFEPLKRRWREGSDPRRFLALEGRLRQNANSWRIIADHPICGVGPGAYETAFRSYNFPNAFKPPRNDPKEMPTWEFFYAKAHNDWLQTLAEWGLPAAGLLLITFLIAYLAPLSTPAAKSLLTFGLWIGILLTLLHASFDYPLQNLAIQLNLAALLAVLSTPPVANGTTHCPTPFCPSAPGDL